LTQRDENINHFNADGNSEGTAEVSSAVNPEDHHHDEGGEG